MNTENKFCVDCRWCVAKLDGWLAGRGPLKDSFAGWLCMRPRPIDSRIDLVTGATVRVGVTSNYCESERRVFVPSVAKDYCTNAGNFFEPKPVVKACPKPPTFWQRFMAEMRTPTNNIEGTH